MLVLLPASHSLSSLSPGAHAADMDMDAEATAAFGDATEPAADEKPEFEPLSAQETLEVRGLVCIAFVLFQKHCTLTLSHSSLSIRMAPRHGACPSRRIGLRH